MIHSTPLTALLDACVLYPAPIRDLLLHLADFELYRPKWTTKIHQERTRNLLMNRPDLTRLQLQKTVRAMDKAFPDATVKQYEPLIVSVNLPDENDRHVLAAALRCRADVIVTSNLKDFPSEYLKSFGIQAQHPDLFIDQLIDFHEETAREAFEQQVAYLKHPPMTHQQVLNSLRKVGLLMTADTLAKLP